jgi:hypothetical protein
VPDFRDTNASEADSVYLQARRAIDLAQSIVDRNLPEARFDWDLGNIDESSPGFGVAYLNGLSLVQAPVTDDSHTWSVCITAGLAYELNGIGEAFSWTNGRNRATALGRYYCPIDESRAMAAILHEHNIWGGLFNLFFGDGCSDDVATALVRRLSTEIVATIVGAAEDSQEVLSRMDGRGFDRSNLNDLFFMRE